MGTIAIFDTGLYVIELIACITGLVVYKKLGQSHWRWFPFYLSFIVLAELPGKYFVRHHMDVANKMFYNYLEIPVEFLFLFWLFSRELKHHKFKKLPLICALVYIVSWLVDKLLLADVDFWFYSFSYTIGNLLLLILILNYLIWLINSDAILKYKEDMMFWVATGMLLFYLGTFPYYGLRNTLVYKYTDLYITYSYVMYVLNSLMYLMFTFSFIWGKPNLKYS